MLLPMKERKAPFLFSVATKDFQVECVCQKPLSIGSFSVFLCDESEHSD
jgi:hypothetical protein